MRPAVSSRIFGHVEQLLATYGYIRGDDGRQYFFLPSFVLSPNDFIDLIDGQRVCFLVTAHPRGLRATGVTVVESEASADGQADRQSAAR